MEIKEISFADIAEHPAFKDMCDEYAAESGNADIGPAFVNKSIYYALEQSGCCFSIGVYEDGDLVGFAVFFTQEHSHYSALIAICDAIWIAKPYRKGMAGLRLIRRVQLLAKEKGAKGVYFSAPEGSRLSMLFKRLFQPKDRVFWAKSKG